MKKILFSFLLFLFSTRPVLAQEIPSPPHLVVNFAAINDLDWGANEQIWQQEVKPKIEAQVASMRTSLAGSESGTVILSWSTLMEYMNFPMDTPSDSSIYAVKMRRILEVAEDLHFPVFVPLNGFQWWDQLPELYNWWDADGTHTDPHFFARQKNPEEFKKRFIAGFNPDNQSNVEWQSLTTPMQLGYRNWGGGGFRLAPPPNLLSPTFTKIQQARLRVILAEIIKKKAIWESEGKGDLFVGLSIGTEISLNASVTPADEFKPYGYRSAQDLGCSAEMKTCRTTVLQSYLETTSQFVNRSGIEKEYIYTHVYGEADANDSHYAPYADSAFNFYSNPGSSFYGHKDNPLSSTQWSRMVKKYGQPTWGAIEYSDTPTANGLVQTFSRAQIVDIYNWDSIQNNAASKQAIKQALTTPLPVQEKSCDSEPVLHIQLGTVAHVGGPEIMGMTINQLPHGIYTQFTETKCGADTIKYSAPQIVFIPITVPIDTTPGWVKLVLRLEDLRFRQFLK